MSVSRLRSSLLSQSSSPFLSVELDVDFGCRTKFSQGYHIRNVIAWTEQNVEEYVGSLRLEFDNIVVHYTATSAVSRRTALNTSLVDCFDCSYGSGNRTVPDLHCLEGLMRQRHAHPPPRPAVF